MHLGENDFTVASRKSWVIGTLKIYIYMCTMLFIIMVKSFRQSHTSIWKYKFKNTKIFEYLFSVVYLDKINYKNYTYYVCTKLSKYNYKYIKIKLKVNIILNK